MGKKWRWGVILDAGSSGTRVYVYRWKDPAREQGKAHIDDLHSLPKLETKDHWTKKIRPGISTFSERPADVGDDHLKKLLDHALDIVPADQVADTPFFLMATAGMRLLKESQQRDIMDEVCAYVRANSDFSLPDCKQQVRVIPGDTEGLYGWIATNYLLGGFNHPEKHNHGKGHHTYGFLDMGGASAQIAFAPNATEAEKHANDLTLLRLRTLDGAASEHRVFSTTWLGFGVNQARERYIKALGDRYKASDASEIPDPCMPRGMRTTLKGDLVESASVDGGITLVGTGQFDACVLETYPLLGKDLPCEDSPCLLNGQHVPAIDFDVNHFIGVSEYWHTTHGVFGTSRNKAYDFNTYQQKVREFCSQDWDDIEVSVAEHEKPKKKEKELKNAQEACFKASWMINVLHDGLGIPRAGLDHSGSPGLNASKAAIEDAQEQGFLDPFQAVNEIDHFEVSWTLGPIVLYASSQVPPTGTGLPVGFGSNVPGVPDDFQYSGSGYNSLGHNETESSWGDAADEILEATSARSGSGFLFFLIVLMVLAFLMRNRERRRKVFNWMQSFTRRRRRPGSPRRGGLGFSLANKLFGRHLVAYERVMEEGDAAHFELGAMDSESDKGSDTGEGSPKSNASGMFSPKTKTPKLSLNRPDDLVLHSSLDRNGLALRTESRERLVPPQMLGAGRRSRTASPTRTKTPLLPMFPEH